MQISILSLFFVISKDLIKKTTYIRDGNVFLSSTTKLLLMIKRTLFFENPAYLCMQNEQLIIKLPSSISQTQNHSIPIEDIGMMVLENSQITLTNRLIDKLTQNKTVIVGCNPQHLPTSLLQPLSGHTQSSKRIREQIEVSEPTKKNLWKQTIIAKITNQIHFLEKQNRPIGKLKEWTNAVKSGDTDNREAMAAAFYWKNIYQIENFTRNPQGEAPNHLLNYGYAILRAITARAIVGTGLLPILGIFHHNKYNSFCLADDIMEPYRVYVDVLVGKIIENATSKAEYQELDRNHKQLLLQLAAMDVVIDGQNSPLMNAMSRTTNSLYECFVGKRRKVLYPVYS